MIDEFYIHDTPIIPCVRTKFSHFDNLNGSYVMQYWSGFIHNLVSNAWDLKSHYHHYGGNHAA